MGIRDGYTFDQAYAGYLAWFHDQASAIARPKEKEKENILGCQMWHEDVFEEETLLLNRVFFLVPLLPSESKSGQLEIFVITELNLLKTTGADDEIEDVIPIKYSIRIFQ